MARFNNNPISIIRPDVRLGKLTTAQLGKHLASEYGYDGFNVVEFQAAQSTNTESDFLKGNPYKTTLVLPSDVSAVVTPLSATFPNLTLLIVGYSGGVVSGLDTAFSGLSLSVVVPNTYLSAYQARYPDFTFSTWVLDVTATVPEDPNSTTLTAEWIRTWVAVAGDTSIVTKVVVPSYYVDYGSGALDEIFEQFANVDTIESPWLNGDDTDGYSLKIPTNGLTSLTDEYFVTALNKNPSTSAVINKVDVSDFSNLSSSSISIGQYTNIKTLVLTYSQDVLGNSIFASDSVCENIIIKSTRVIQFGMQWTGCQLTKSGIKRITTDTTYKLNGLYYSGTAFPSTIEELDFTKSGGWVNGSNQRLFYNNSAGASSVKKIYMGDVSDAIYLSTNLFSLQLENVTDFKADNIKNSANISYILPNLSLASLQYLIDQLYNYSGDAQHTFTIGATNLAKLTADDIAIATAKNWSVVA